MPTIAIHMHPRIKTVEYMLLTDNISQKLCFVFLLWK